jgi:malate dehydrogenase (oxaloacetate-decarboxylating)
LPVSLDVGTGRQDLIDDPHYLGVRQKRLTGQAYLDFIDAFVAMVKARWPAAVIQWEDLAKEVAFEVLERHRDTIASFNDDIQGTGAVALAGVLAACRRSGVPLREQVVVIHGAGAGGIGVALAIRSGMEREGLSRNEATRRILVLDSGGLLTEARGISGYKAPFAQAGEVTAGWRFAGKAPDLFETVRESGATVLLGLSGQPGAFDEAVVRQAAANTQHPIIFPLSNPTSSSEATPEDIFRWTDGRAMVATGSPFEPVVHGNRNHPVGQGNNAFIFPGLGMAAIIGYVTKITDGMVMAASDALVAYTERHFPELLYPPVAHLAEASIAVATKVLETALAEGVATLPERWVARGALERLEDYVRAHFWEPKYIPFVKGEARPF